MATTVNLTDNDRKILIMAWQSFKNAPTVDYIKLQAMGGYKTPASATTCYLAARKRLLASNGAKMTDNDRKLIVMAWQCFKTPPEVDYKALQHKGNYKTTASATTCYLAVKKKLLGPAADATTTAPTASATKAGGTKRKVGKKAAAEYDVVPKRIKADGDVKDGGTKAEDGGEANSEPDGDADADGEVQDKLLATAQEYLESVEGEGEGA